MKRNDNFYFPSSSAYCYLFWLEMKLVWFFFNFLNFIAFIFKFFITRREGTERNDNFYFLSFSSFSNLFWLEMKSEWYFLIFLIFLLFFCHFQVLFRLERNGTIISVFSLSQPFPTYFGFK